MSATYKLEPGDKVTPVTAFLAQSVVSGDLVTREAMRVSTWLKTPGLPDFASLYDVTVLRAGASGTETIQLDEFFLPIAHVLAIQLASTHEDKADFDPNEQNRKMEPVTALSGCLRVDGSLRMPGHLTLSKQMGVLREPFTMLYDTVASTTLQPGVLKKCNMTLIRSGAFAFASRA